MRAGIQYRGFSIQSTVGCEHSPTSSLMAVLNPHVNYLKEKI
jgi:hypothetical protein